MGIVAYRDIGDDYVTRTFDLTTDIQDLYANLLELKARGGGDWPESVNAALAGAARDTERVWRDIARNGNGRFIPIPQDGGQVVIIETPYDDDIIILQKEINGTVIPYGPRALQKHTEDKTRQLSQVAAAAPAQASEMASYLNKRAKVSSEAVTGDGDLVSDVTAGRTS